MTQGGLIGSDAGGVRAERLAVVKFVEESGPHLQNGIGESELEDAAGDGLERGLVAHLDLLPDLLAVRHAHDLEDVGVGAGPTGGR